MPANGELEPGSFRDRAGAVFYRSGKVLRHITPSYAEEYERARDTGTIDELIANGRLVGTTEVSHTANADGHSYEVEHSRIPYISYPYEWPFALLKSAALFHLELQEWLLQRGFILRDASAYNVQFQGVKPIFIDLLSIGTYQEGIYWLGHRQFCEQFLNPLLLRSKAGIAHNEWYRGRLEGISTADLRRALPFRKKLSLNVLTQVVLSDILQTGSEKQNEKPTPNKTLTKPLPKTAYGSMLASLRSWITTMRPAGKSDKNWGAYANFRNYTDETLEQKSRFVAEFCQNTRPETIFDIGCNTGEFSQIALKSGATRVIAFDYDQDCLDQAYARATSADLNLLPLYLDAANPSPNQGWQQSERKGFMERSSADGLLALAFEHHLAIGRNVPLDRLIDWLLAIAPCGVVEFIDRADSKIQQMLSTREDIFQDHNLQNFDQLISQRARIIKRERLSSSHRYIYWYER